MLGYKMNPIFISGYKTQRTVIKDANYGLRANGLHQFVVNPVDNMAMLNAKALIQSNPITLSLNFLTGAMVVNSSAKSNPTNGVQTSTVSYQPAGVASSPASKTAPTPTRGIIPTNLGTLVAAFKG